MGFTSLAWVLQAPSAKVSSSPASRRATALPDVARGRELFDEHVARLEEEDESDALEFVPELKTQIDTA